MGGETSKVADMARKVSEDIFGVFGWELVLPADQNWVCVTPDHEKARHPSDVVFRYRHPYRPTTVHLTTDLKSFAASSVTKQQMGKALRSLAMSASCASVSESWQTLYAAPDSTLEVGGMLFVYNHDGSYEGDFEELLVGADAHRLPVSSNTYLHVVGPRRVAYLATVANDILKLRGAGALPPAGDRFWFFYPDLISEHARADQPKAATVETLCGPIIAARYLSSTSSAPISGVLVYYERSGATVDEFKYLLDYLFRYQLLNNCDEVRIRLPAATDTAPAVFKRAVAAYLSDFNELTDLRGRLERVRLELVTNVVKVFSVVALGMEPRE